MWKLRKNNENRVYKKFRESSFQWNQCCEINIKYKYFEAIKLRLENWALWGVNGFQDGFGMIGKIENIGKKRKLGDIRNLIKI